MKESPGRGMQAGLGHLRMLCCSGFLFLQPPSSQARSSSDLCGYQLVHLSRQVPPPDVCPRAADRNLRMAIASINLRGCRCIQAQAEPWRELLAVEGSGTLTWPSTQRQLSLVDGGGLRRHSQY